MPRTTIHFPDDLFQKARAKAARKRLDLSDVLRRLLVRWVSEEIPPDREESTREALVAKARASRGMWADRNPDTYLEESRSQLPKRDEDLDRARLDL